MITITCNNSPSPPLVNLLPPTMATPHPTPPQRAGTPSLRTGCYLSANGNIGLFNTTIDYQMRLPTPPPERTSCTTPTSSTSSTSSAPASTLGYDPGNIVLPSYTTVTNALLRDITVRAPDYNRGSVLPSFARAFGAYTDTNGNIIIGSYDGFRALVVFLSRPSGMNRPSGVPMEHEALVKKKFALSDLLN